MSKKSPARSGQKKPAPKAAAPARPSVAKPAAASNGAAAPQGGLGAVPEAVAAPVVAEAPQATQAPAAAAAMPGSPLPDDAYARKLEFATGHALSAFQFQSQNGISPKMAVMAHLRVVGMAMQVFNLWGELSVAEEVQAGRVKQQAFMASSQQATAQAEADARLAAGQQPS